MKAMRGTKRVCQACAARFYDLSREPILCPSCGAHYVPDAPPTAAGVGARAARFTDKTGWRGRTFKHPDPDVAPATASTDDTDEEAPAPNDYVVLDEEHEEPDESDVSDLLGPHKSDPKER